MSSQGFSFPPPPPPPPQQQQQPQNHAAYPSAAYGQGHQYGQRGGRGASGHRGRGRGGNRGGRGGYYASDASHQMYSNPSAGYAPMNYSGYPAQSLPSHTPTPNIPPSQYTSQNFQHQNVPAYSQPYSQPAAPVPYQQQGYNAYNQPTQAQNHNGMNPQQHAAAQPHMMAPPMHWGFDPTGYTGSFPGAQRGHARGRPYNPHGYQMHGDKRQHQNKRDHGAAFGRPQSGPRTPAPPAVPSFGNPLPSKPPASNAQNSNKKKRKHNQLGLTPKVEEHESSEEEDDVDEESKLAPGSAAALEFTYKGRTSTLNSSTDIAAWIEERKKKFPTNARIEEKKKAMEEAKKARDEALKQKDAKKQESKRLLQEARAQKSQEKQGNKPDAANVAEKAKQKADKLRRKLEKEEKRIAKAEADAEQARLKVEALQKSMDNDQTTQATLSSGQPQALGTITAPDQGSSSVETSDVPQPAPHTSEQTDIPEALEALDVASDSESSDWTSSSGSGSDLSDSDSDIDSAPEEVTSRREGPERVPPPPREGKKRVCRHFARNGRCMRGDKCKFAHEPERGAKSKPPEKGRRKGLLQSLLDRDKQDETRKVMEAITWLGDNGMLGTG